MDEQETTPERATKEMNKLTSEIVKILCKPFADSTTSLTSAFTDLSETAQTLQNTREEAIKAQADAALATMKAIEATQKVEAAAGAMSSARLQVELAAAVATEARDGLVVNMTQFLTEMGEPEGVSEDFIKSATSSLDRLTRDFKGL